MKPWLGASTFQGTDEHTNAHGTRSVWLADRNSAAAATSASVIGVSSTVIASDRAASRVSAAMAPPLPARSRQPIDRVVERVEAVECPAARRVQAGAVVLAPVRDAEFPVVAHHLVDPAFADEGDVAHYSRRREPRQIAHH